MPFAIVILMFCLICLYISRKIPGNVEASRNANPVTLYPSAFFAEVFQSCEEDDKSEIENLQNDIAALQHTHATANPRRNISQAVNDITQKYGMCLQNYLLKFQNEAERKVEIIRLKNKIELERKVINNEKSAFLSDNGSDVRSFVFNRQNQLTDTFFVGIGIPTLLVVLSWDIKKVDDFFDVLAEKPAILYVIVAFCIVFIYRIIKYIINKRSMLRCMQQTVLYDKVDAMLSSFECALKTIDITCEE